MFDPVSTALAGAVANVHPNTPGAPVPDPTLGSGGGDAWGMAFPDMSSVAPGQWYEPPAPSVAPSVKPKPALPLSTGNPADEQGTNEIGAIPTSPAVRPVVPQIDPAVDPHAAYAQAWHSDQPASALSPSTVALQKSAAEQSADAEREYQAAYTAAHGVSGGA